MNMEVKHKQGVLILDGGFLKPTYKIPVSQIKSWKFVAEGNGATYYIFSLGESNQHVSISSNNAESLKFEIQEIRRITGQEPEIEISQSRLPSGSIFLAADISLGVLGALILTMGAG